MIEYIKGAFVEKNPAYVVIEASGIGYYVHTSMNTFTDITSATEGSLFIHYAVSVDVRSGESKHQLYGFSSLLERHLFRLLLSVSGVSATIGRMILSGFKPGDIQSAILNGDSKTLTSVKGVGPKLAQRIVGELREKLAKDGEIGEISAGSGNTLREEALSALAALGFDRSSSAKVVNKLLNQDVPPGTIEDLIRLSLKQL